MARLTQDLFQRHTIVPDGYDIGRDLLVRAATKGSRFGAHKWRASAEYIDGLLRPGSKGARC